MKREKDKLIFDSGRVIPADELVIVAPDLGYYYFNDDHGFDDQGGYEFKVLDDLTPEEYQDGVKFMQGEWAKM